MMIEFYLESKDATGKITKSQEIITFPSFVKELSFAGINSKLNPLDNCFRILTTIFEFAPSFFDKQFHIHPELQNDPTEKAHFSNKVGRAFSVYLEKKICGAKYVYSYECVLKYKGYKISVDRPDYYCNTTKQFFSLEAKGYSSNSFSDKKMQDVKAQANSGPLQKSFSIASATFNIYKSPKVKFYDPDGDSLNYDQDFADLLRKNYYSEVLRILNSSFFTLLKETEKEANDFYVYAPFVGSDFFKILVHKSIVENKDLKEEIPVFETEDKFIDSDGIGLALNLEEIFKQMNKNKI